MVKNQETKTKSIEDIKLEVFHRVTEPHIVQLFISDPAKMGSFMEAVTDFVFKYQPGTLTNQIHAQNNPPVKAFKEGI